MTTAAMHVVAGVLLDPAGRLLLAQRPPGKHLAGLWEFPGGKLEAGESPVAGLLRELSEELDIRIDPASAVPLIQVPWNYGERALLLDTWVVGRWQGTPRSAEGQGLRWILPADIAPDELAPADRVILQEIEGAL
ncbi:(deoxy)nucleoside triphosphate pyrophosphohydrolase [Frateuria sp. STR12]|uniref:(deoxy)nucleoside triphosphate pyrophosphohydrolase n=1 Tax=Frateuria hangzhouensis TaxID=2995589 RepID=UPI002260F3AF|nr:(deoxy)nucleoside triphosphate pyrophosphohydrolase [Frateuria sp. STR12]MCX7513750.1 (deoxy)nucleoside triphosphate pyrophosphohydrolase [Frateuria sp. STR12]